MVAARKSWIKSWGVLIGFCIQIALLIWFAAGEHAKVVSIEDWMNKEAKPTIACMVQMKTLLEYTEKTVTRIEANIGRIEQVVVSDHSALMVHIAEEKKSSSNGDSESAEN